MPQLREHQIAIVDKIYEGFNQGHRCQLLWGVTGLGKTEISIKLMQDFAKDYKSSAMVMDRIVLVDQTSLRLTKYGIDHGVLQANHWRFRPHERIQVCSIQTLAKRNRHFKPELLIVDECHIRSTVVDKLIRDNPDMKVVGLTATPFTNGLGKTYTNVVAGPTYEDIIQKEWLVPLKVFIAKEIDMTGAKKVAGEWSTDEVTQRGVKITGDVVAEWESKTMDIFGKPVKTIVFSAGVDHGRDLEKKFKEAGYNFLSISYKEDDEFKRRAIEEFSKPDSEIVGLIATDILTRGFDVPDVMIGVSARPFSKSLSSHVQQIGRIMRPYPGKSYGIWLDHSGNFLRFRKDWDELFTDGVTRLDDGKEKAKKEPTEKEKKEAKCPKCKALWTWPSDTCGECGYIRQRLSSVQNVAGKMEELDFKGNKGFDKQQFYSELLFYARTKGYNEGWAAHKFKERVGTFPKGLEKTSRMPSMETSSWIKSRMIAYAKSKAKNSSSYRNLSVLR
jgi:DNA repair protein RadD